MLTVKILIVLLVGFLRVNKFIYRIESNTVYGEFDAVISALSIFAVFFIGFAWIKADVSTWAFLIAIFSDPILKLLGTVITKISALHVRFLKSYDRKGTK